MITRRNGIAAATAVLLLFSLLAAPSLNASEKGSALVVEGWEVVGNKVMVKVSNQANAAASGSVEVRAMVGGVPVRSFQTVRLGGGASDWVTVGFFGPVGGVIAVGMIDSADPVV